MDFDRGTASAQIAHAPHPGYHKLFAPDHLTLGLIMPLETYPNAPAPTMEGHLAMAKKADESGFSALWMRDVPLYDPNYGDVGQIFDPLIYIAALATITHSIALGTAGIVLPFREPAILAKQVASLDHLSGGRMMLGLSSGDRPSEYPFFGIDFETRGDRFRDGYGIFRALTDQKFPIFESPRFGTARGYLDLIPKPPHGRTPSIAIGRSQQSIEWIAKHMDGFITPAPPADLLPSLVSEWRGAVQLANGEGVFKPIGIAGYLDLVSEREHPLQRIRAGFRTGSKTLARFLEAARAAGVNHVALNPKVSDRPYTDLMDDLARDVLPDFPSLTTAASLIPR